MANLEGYVISTIVTSSETDLKKVSDGFTRDSNLSPTLHMEANSFMFQTAGPLASKYRRRWKVRRIQDPPVDLALHAPRRSLLQIQPCPVHLQPANKIMTEKKRERVSFGRKMQFGVIDHCRETLPAAKSTISSTFCFPVFRSPPANNFPHSSLQASRLEEAWADSGETGSTDLLKHQFRPLIGKTTSLALIEKIQCGRCPRTGDPLLREKEEDGGKEKFVRVGI